MAKKPTGRPSLLTPEVQAKIVRGIVDQGLYAEIAAVNAGVGRSTYMAWRRRGTVEPDSVYGEFARAIDEALSQSEANDTEAHLKIAHDKSDTKVTCPECGEQFRASIPNQVQLAALQWRMQRKYGARWGEKQTVVIEQQAQAAVEELLDAVKPLMPTESYAHLIDAIATAMGDPGMAGQPPGGDTAH